MNLIISKKEVEMKKVKEGLLFGIENSELLGEYGSVGLYRTAYGCLFLFGRGYGLTGYVDEESLWSSENVVFLTQTEAFEWARRYGIILENFGNFIEQHKGVC